MLARPGLRRGFIVAGRLEPGDPSSSGAFPGDLRRPTHDRLPPFSKLVLLAEC